MTVASKSSVVAIPPSSISAQIWDMKYRLKTIDGQPVDFTIEDSWRRVANALAVPEGDAAAKWEAAFYDILEDFKFLPAGRIVSGAGTGRTVTMFNCFVMGDIPDDMGGIFQSLKEAALTMQQGGGIGYDFSTLRPKGAPVKGVGADASGPLSFMDVWDAMCRTIMSAGSRRGAMMAAMRCDHPDIEAFIDAKSQPGRLRMFNLSVLVTDAFMAAVERDADWHLVFDGMTYKTLPARELWDRIMRATYACAEPGVIFIDRVNRLNNLWYCENIHATNPCGEMPLPPYGVCLLGSVNFARLVVHAFEIGAQLDLSELKRIVRIAVRMMDNVIDVSKFPLPLQEQEARTKRRIGLGITGLADALIMCGARYGSEEAVRLTEEWMAALRREAYLASIDLAKEKGAFPMFDRDQYLAGENIKSLDADIQAAIGEHGIRNALLTSIAPTGTISLYADNVSSGLEPVFSFSYTRQVLEKDGSRRTEEVEDYAYRLFRHLKGAEAPLPPAFVDTQKLPPVAHVTMQAVVQKYVDNAISKTINLPKDIDFDDFKSVYGDAYKAGCKGCTTYRPNEVTGSVLEVKADVAPATAEIPAVTAPPVPKQSPNEMDGWTVKITNPDTERAIFITVNHTVDDLGCRHVNQVFAHSLDGTVEETLKGAAVSLSKALRSTDKTIADELLDTFALIRGSATFWFGHKCYTSALELLAGVVRHRQAILLTECEGIKAGAVVPATSAHPSPAATERSSTATCQRCGSQNIKHDNGCPTCLDCGNSRCG